MRAEVHRSWLIMAISGQYSEVSLRDNVGRPSSEQLCVEWNATSVTADEFYGSGEFRLSFIRKTLALNSLFSNSHVKKIACFYGTQFGWISRNISLSESVLETKKLQTKVLNSTWRTFQFVNYCRM